MLARLAALLAAIPGRAVVSGNIVAIVGDEAVAVIDTGHHPRLTRQIVGEIRALTPKPVRYVVNTHWHNDHVSGNYVFEEAWPGVTIVAHAFTASPSPPPRASRSGRRCSSDSKARPTRRWFRDTAR